MPQLVCPSMRGRRRNDSFALLATLMFGAAVPAMAQASAAPSGGGASHSIFAGPSMMIDHTTNHFDRRPHALGVEADYTLFRVDGLGAISLPARIHYYSNFNPLGDGGPQYHVISLAAGLAYHPLPDRRLDPYAGATLRYRRRADPQADSTTFGPLLDAGVRFHLASVIFVQGGMSFVDVNRFGLFRAALVFKF
jgi:hypothetical protein